MEKNEIVTILLDLHEWRMEDRHRAINFEHTVSEEDGNYVTIELISDRNGDNIRSTHSFWYDTDETYASIKDKLEEWKDKVQKYERVAEGMHI